MRVTLGRPMAGDTPAISIAMLDPEVSEWLHTFPFPYVGQSDREDRISAGVPTDYAVRVDGRFAGIVLATPELGCWIDPKYRSKGIATRAAMLALSRHFMTGARIAHARHLTGNQAMKSILEQLGYRPDPTIAPSARERGIALMRLTLEDFARAQPFRISTGSAEVVAVTEDDLPLLYDIVSMRDVGGTLIFYRPGMTVDELGALLPGFAGLPPFWCVIRMQGQVIGGIGLESRVRPQGDPDMLVHCFISPAASGLGICSQVLAAFVTELGDRFNLRRLMAEIFTDDHAAAGLVAAAGFRPEGAALTMLTPARSGMVQRFVLQNDG